MSKSKPKSKRLTADQVARICAVSLRTVKNWVSSSHPSPFPRRKGPKGWLWDAASLVEWLRASGKDAEADRMVGYLGGIPEKKPAADPVGNAKSVNEFSRREAAAARRLQQTGTAAIDPADALGPAADMDIFATRNVIARMLVQAVARYTEASATQVQSESKTVRDTADTLRKLELDGIEVDARLKRLIPMELVEKIVGRILAEARTNLQTLRHSMVQDLAAITDTEEVSAYLDKQFTAALRCLEASYLAAEVSAYMPEDAT